MLHLLILSLSVLRGDAFSPLHHHHSTFGTSRSIDATGKGTLLRLSSSSAFAVPVAELEQNLTVAERSITGVVRSASPSVAYVTSVWPALPGTQRRGSNGRRRSTDDSKNSMPQGQSLGSGSGFIIESDGYVVTNYHVIQASHRIQSMQRSTEDQFLSFLRNLTGSMTLFPRNEWLENILHQTTLRVQPVPPKVYCRINSASEYLPCRVVQVQPDLDVAVLKIENSTTSSDSKWPTVSFGSSGDLLVGQSLVAIGNPFGLDMTVTSGVVSALNREISTSPSQRIRNCIQTDAAINPGNSGGPLLNLAGDVVGVNTAIVSTSGSNAGIGFAIPSDKVQPVVREMIRSDRVKRGIRPEMGYLGIGFVKTKLNKTGNWILSVDPDSEAAKAGLKPLEILPSGRIQYGDALVAVSGNFVSTYDELMRDMERRVVGEELSFTVEDGETGDRRIVYIKLGKRP